MKYKTVNEVCSFLKELSQGMKLSGWSAKQTKTEMRVLRSPIEIFEMVAVSRTMAEHFVLLLLWKLKHLQRPLESESLKLRTSCADGIKREQQ